MNRTLATACTVASLSLGLTARADSIHEPSTEHDFDRDPTYAGTAFHCQAAGIRKKAFIKVYAIAFCLDKAKAADTVAAAKAATGGEVTADSAKFFSSLRDARVAKAADMFFARNVGKDKIAEAYEETLKKALGADDADGQAKFLALVNRDVKEGEHIVLTTAPDGTIHLSIGGQDQTFTDPKIAQHIWNAWLGPDGVSPSLKEALADSVK